MDEENKDKPTTDNIGEGDKPKSSTLIDDTNLAAKRLEEATEAAKEERLIREESYAQMKLAGNAEAGQSSVKKEESNAEYAERVASGN